MRIENIETIKINPQLRDHNKGHEVRFAGIDTQTIFRVTCDNGIIGYGDSRGHTQLAEAETEKIIGNSPFEFIGADLHMGLMGALYDAMGKDIDQPAYKLIGQKVRDRIPVAAWTRPASPEDFANEIERASKDGYRIFKMHTCPHHCVIEQTRAAEEVAPDGFKIHYDFNHNRSEADTLRIIDQVERSPVVGFLEDPLRWQNIEGWKMLRQRTSLPLLMHVPQLGGGPEIVYGCADLYMVGEVGFGNSLRRGFTAASSELSTVIQLTGGTLSKAFAMHLGAVLPAVSHSVNLDDQYAEDVTSQRLEVDEGATPVPNGPGLGVNVDESILKKLSGRPKSELPKHVGILELPGGSIYYTPSIPAVESITGFSEGNVIGIKSQIWNDDGSEKFESVYTRVQKEGACKA
jgi:L-alanine-DL-glutamate epimerase-like enolase superfamily enzyme